MDSSARLALLERQVRSLRLVTAACLALVLTISVAAWRRPEPAPEVLRVRGLIVVDDAGRDRILIGAPVPASGARARTDMARVRELWGRTFGERYMREWYPTYRNAVHGMVVLDEHGIDRLAIGDSLPDPNIGRRIGSDAGILVNDSLGYERTGYGVLTVKGRDRVVLGLDNNSGEEGLTLSVYDSAAGVTVNSGGRRLYIGGDPDADAGAPLFGIIGQQGKKVLHKVNMLPAP